MVLSTGNAMNKTHRPCFCLAIIFMLGIITGTFLSMPLWIWLTLGAAALIIFFDQRFNWMMYVLVFLLGAVWIVERNLLPPQCIAFLSFDQRQNLEAVEGAIDSDVMHQKWARGDKTVFDLSLRQILVEGKWNPSVGKVRVELYGDQNQNVLHYGQMVHISGKVHPIFNGKANTGFSYRQYLQNQGVYWILSVSKAGSCEVIKDSWGNIFVAGAIFMRHQMIAVFDRYLMPMEAGFVAAIVLGDRSGMPKDLKEIFANTGTAHILPTQ